MKRLKSFEAIFLACAVVFSILAPHPGIHISNNSSHYLFEASSLAQGHPPTLYKNGLVARGPLFPYSMALLFAAGGPSVSSAFILMKVFFALLLAFLYFLARDYYDKKTAFLSIILAVVSFRIYLLGTAIDTTSLLACFLLGFLLFLHRSSADGGRIRYFLCGLFLSLAYLTKETAIVFAPLLLFPLWPKAPYHVPLKPPISAKIGWISLGALPPLLPWAAYVFAKTSSFLPLLGHFNPEFRSAFSNKAGADVTQNFFQNFFQYLIGFLISMLPFASFLSPLLIALLGWHVIHLMVRRSKNPKFLEDSLLLFSIILYLPIPMSDMAVGAGDPRQGFVIYLLLFLLGARWMGAMPISFVSQKLKDILPFRKVAILTGGVALIVLGIAFKTFHGHPTVIKMTRAMAKYHPIPEVKGRYTRLQEEGIRWIGENVPADVPLVSDGYLEEPLRFFTSDRYLVTASFQPKTSFEQAKTRPVFLITYKKFRESQGLDRRFFWVLDEDSLISHLHEGVVIVFAHQSGFLDEYFRAVPWAKPLFHNEHFFAYKMIGKPQETMASSAPVYISDHFEDDMEWAKSNDPQAFANLVAVLRSWGMDYNALLKTARRLKPGIFL